MGLSIPLLLVWLLVFRRKLPSVRCPEAASTPMERSHSSYQNPQLAARHRAICLELLTEGRLPTIRLRLNTWSVQLSLWITPLLKASATTDIQPRRTLL